MGPYYLRNTDSMAVVESSRGGGVKRQTLPSLLGIFVLRRTLVYSKEGDPGRAEQGNQRGLMYV